MNDALVRSCTQLLGEENALRDEPMSAHTSFRVGGPADLFLRVFTARQLQSALALLDEANMSYFLLGRGSNLLVGDGGYRGAIITMSDAVRRSQDDDAGSDRCSWEEMLSGRVPMEPDGRRLPLTGIVVSGSRIVAGAGETLFSLSAAARDHALAGLEFASGIPGSLGGALVMNAGAYGGSMDQVIETVFLLMPDGKITEVSGEEMQFGYRSSLLKKIPAIALGAVLHLREDESAAIDLKMRELSLQRRQKQPLEYPSAGSTFQRPEGYYAGKLIMEAGLRGFQIGGAAVSDKHCGFVINKGDATAADIRAVIREVRGRVKETAGVDLEEEVISLGDFTEW